MSRFLPPAAACQKKMRGILPWVVPLLLINALHAQAPTARDTAYMDSVFRAHRYPIALESGQLAGAGARFLLDASRDAQFFVIGESHYVAQIPPFAEALFSRLNRERGYNYYAVEFGPVITAMLSASHIRGDTARTFALARKYPHAFQFWDDEEIDAFARISRQSTARSEPLWGLDNEWGALHALDRLVTIAPTVQARALARGLNDRARGIESARPYATVEFPRFISDADSAAFDSLRAAFGPPPGSEAAFLLEALETSNRIYLFDRGANLGHGTGYRANADRERYMKGQFMTQYRRAQRNGDSLPRVLVKIGSTHGGNWRSPTYVQSLGNFLHEFALSNERTSFHLVVWLVNEPNTYWTLGDNPAYLPLERVGSTSEWAIVDFRPLRDLWYAGKLPALSRELRDAVFAYDAALLLGSGTRGTHDQLRAR